MWMQSFGFSQLQPGGRSIDAPAARIELAARLNDRLGSIPHPTIQYLLGNAVAFDQTCVLFCVLPCYRYHFLSGLLGCNEDMRITKQPLA